MYYLQNFDSILEGFQTAFDWVVDAFFVVFPALIILAILGMIAGAVHFGRSRFVSTPTGVFPKKRKYIAFALVGLVVFVFGMSLATGSVSAIAFTCSKTTVKANIPFKCEATGLTAATHYTVYVDDTLEINRSTGATETTATYEIVLGDDKVDTMVQIDLKDITGAATTHGTVYVTVEYVIEQHVVDMLGGLIPAIVVFGILGIFITIPTLMFAKVKGMI